MIAASADGPPNGGGEVPGAGSDHQGLLDRLDPRRYDVEAIVRLAREHERLPEDEQEGVTVWEYSGAEGSEHPFSVPTLLTPDRPLFVVRDITGELMLVAADQGWWARPLYRDDLPPAAELDDWLDELRPGELPGIDPAVYRAAIDTLPTA